MNYLRFVYLNVFILSSFWRISLLDIVFWIYKFHPLPQHFESTIFPRILVCIFLRRAVVTLTIVPLSVVEHFFWSLLRFSRYVSLLAIWLWCVWKYVYFCCLEFVELLGVWVGIVYQVWKIWAIKFSNFFSICTSLLGTPTILILDQLI